MYSEPWHAHPYMLTDDCPVMLGKGKGSFRLGGSCDMVEDARSRRSQCWRVLRTSKV
jgi:hypothetical protein